MNKCVKNFKSSFVLVDDEGDLRGLFKDIIEHHIGKVYQAESGAVALDILKDERVDISILDIKMPGMDGLELLENIEDKYPKMINMTLSSSSERGNIKRALRSRAIDFLDNPVKSEYLIERIKDDLSYKYSLTREEEEEEVKIIKNSIFMEKTKELNCLYKFSEIIGRHEISIEKIINKLLNIIPLGFEFTDILCVKIKFHDREFKSANYVESQINISENIFVQDIKVGEIKISYMEERKICLEYPFSYNEKHLLKELAIRLGNIFKLKLLEKEQYEKQIAFQTIFREIESEKKKLSESVSINIEKTVKPIVKTLKALIKNDSLNKKYTALFSVLEKNINNINSDHSDSINIKYKLTRKENEIYQLIQSGKLIKEISSILSISESTVKNHVGTIKKKLGIKHLNKSLKKYLAEL